MTMKTRMPPWVLPLGAVVAMVAVLMLSLYTQRPPGLVLLDAASGEWRTVDRHFIRMRASQNATALAVATLVLNQGRYLREWIQFHRLMGVGLFVIFDDNSTDATTTVLRDFIAAGTVHLVHARASFHECAERHLASHYQGLCQKAVFNLALSQLRGKVVWMGNFDIDEFLWTPEGAPPLLAQLLGATYAAYDQISIRAMVFGTSNLSQPIPANQTVIEAFTWRAALPDSESAPYYGARFGHKTLYRPDKMWRVDVHTAECSFRAACRVTHIDPLAANLRMNHYQFKSRAEQRAKAVANGNPYIAVNEPRDALLNAVHDRSITYIAPQLLRVM